MENPHEKIAGLIKLLATVALITIAYFAIAIIILHFLRPDVNPVSGPTSEYAVGRFGFLMSAAFFSMSLATFCLLIGLYRGIIRPALSRIGLFLFGIWGAGVLIAMSFPINPHGTELTATSTIHRINGPIVFLSLTIGSLLISRSFRRDKNWHSFYPTALTLSLIMLVVFILTVLNVATSAGLEGLCQRIYLTMFVCWFILTTLHLRSTVTK